MVTMDSENYEMWMISASDLSNHHGPTIHFVELAMALSYVGMDLTCFVPGPNRYDGEISISIDYTKTLIPWVPRTFSFQVELFMKIVTRIFFSKKNCVVLVLTSLHLRCHCVRL